jgi:hypothetical protein
VKRCLPATDGPPDRPVQRKFELVARLRTTLFAALWLLIVVISVHDGLLVVANRTSMAAAEQNPVGRWLIELSGGDIWLLLAAKGAGTICTSTLLLLLYWSRGPLGLAACAGVAAFQVGLLVYLHCS